MARGENEEETVVAEITTGMETVMMEPSESFGDDVRMESVHLLAAAEGQATIVSPAKPQEDTALRPFDVVRNAGPPQEPLPFPPPVIERGLRDSVLCYNPRTQRFIRADNVLFRDYSRDFGDDDSALQRVEQGYWPIPQKGTIKTIMGFVQIHVILKRCPRERDDDDCSSDEESQEDIVFQVTKDYVAIKVNDCDRMERMRNKHAEDPLKEIAAMQLIGNDHPNVMGCMEVLFDGKNKNLNVIMPFCGAGDLFSFLQESQKLLSTPGLPEHEAKVLFRQIVSGLKHMHSKGVVHRDISPENIMLNTEGCLIIDMGMALRIPYADANGRIVADITHETQKRLIKPQGACGKLPYMSPEIYRNRDAFDGEAVDVWTSGTILFCMLSGNRSYEIPHKSDPQFYWMTHGMETLLKDWGVELSDEALDLLRGMLTVDPRQRLTIDEIEKHPWFADQGDPSCAHC